MGLRRPGSNRGEKKTSSLLHPRTKGSGGLPCAESPHDAPRGLCAPLGPTRIFSRLSLARPAQPPPFCFPPCRTTPSSSFGRPPRRSLSGNSPRFLRPASSANSAPEATLPSSGVWPCRGALTSSLSARDMSGCAWPSNDNDWAAVVKAGQQSSPWGGGSALLAPRFEHRKGREVGGQRVGPEGGGIQLDEAMEGKIHRGEFAP